MKIRIMYEPSLTNKDLMTENSSEVTYFLNARTKCRLYGQDAIAPIKGSNCKIYHLVLSRAPVMKILILAILAIGLADAQFGYGGYYGGRSGRPWRRPGWGPGPWGRPGWGRPGWGRPGWGGGWRRPLFGLSVNKPGFGFGIGIGKRNADPEAEAAMPTAPNMPAMPTMQTMPTMPMTAMPTMPATPYPTYPMRNYPYYPSFYPMAAPMPMPWPMTTGMGMTMTPAQTATPTKVEADPASMEEMTDMTDLEVEEQDEVEMEKRAAEALLPLEISKTTPFKSFGLSIGSPFFGGGYGYRNYGYYPMMPYDPFYGPYGPFYY